MMDLMICAAGCWWCDGVGEGGREWERVGESGRVWLVG